MESSACSGSTSDADQSTRSCSVTVKYEHVMVKEEPEWGECGVSEAAAAEGLYAGHRVKDELVFEPVLIKQQDIVQHNIQDTLGTIKEDPRTPKVESDADTAEFTDPEDGLGSNGSSEQHLQRSQPLQTNYMPSRAEEDACKLKPAGEAAPATESTRAQSDLTTRQHAHTGQKPHSCEICHKQFKFRSFLVRHLRSHKDVLSITEVAPERTRVTKRKKKYTEKEPHGCDICHKRFTYPSFLVRHLRSHRDVSGTQEAPASESKVQSATPRTHKQVQKPHSCNICHTRFKYRSFLIRHLRTHTGEKPFCCDYCNKMFTQKATLIGHIHIHTGEKLHNCNVCNKQFRKRSTLMKHMKIHPDEKPYSCDVCDERFTHRVDMITHKSTHTDENFTCHLCKKQLTRKSALVKHIRTHTGEKPFSCDICNSRFTLRHHLNSHIRIHTGEKPYSCYICDKRFARRRTMTLHIRKHTGHLSTQTGYILTVEPLKT